MSLMLVTSQAAQFDGKYNAQVHKGKETANRPIPVWKYLMIQILNRRLQFEARIRQVPNITSHLVFRQSDWNLLLVQHRWMQQQL
jgi:hypothetical protein